MQTTAVKLRIGMPNAARSTRFTSQRKKLGLVELDRNREASLITVDVVASGAWAERMMTMLLSASFTVLPKIRIITLFRFMPHIANAAARTIPNATRVTATTQMTPAPCAAVVTLPALQALLVLRHKIDPSIFELTATVNSKSAWGDCE
jgi:hypothetical protein